MFRIKNWESFQSYKDRNPPWIRLHKKLLDDYKFQKMTAESRALLPMLWLLAAEDDDPVSGMLRIGYEEISFRLRQCEKGVKTAMDEILRAGFLEKIFDEEMPLFSENTDSYANVTKMLRNCHPETETETEKYTPLKPPHGGAKKTHTKTGRKKNGRKARETNTIKADRAAREVLAEYGIIDHES